MSFDTQKSSQLKRQDFSKKGSVDGPVKNLIKKINKNPNYYTTSSCSGRIIILTDEKKQNTKWQFVSHNKTSIKELKSALKTIPKQPLWFRFEPMILHIACKTIEDASKITEKAKSAGFKHSGIFSINKRIIAEIRGTDFISSLISKNNKLAVNDSYLKIILEEANKKMKRNLEKIKKFEFMVS
ncbi:hypothetical protein KY308_00540 [Candidatus Woesearchaeota archaeon]|nr:hypothetical protein [Candidatus Woesearchaeota archaeon]